MGLGKTSITLTAINALLFNSFEVHKVLVVAPLRVARDTWSAEIEKWEHLKNLRYSVVVGSEQERILGRFIGQRSVSQKHIGANIILSHPLLF